MKKENKVENGECDTNKVKGKGKMATNDLSVYWWFYLSLVFFFSNILDK